MKKYVFTAALLLCLPLLATAQVVQVGIGAGAGPGGNAPQVCVKSRALTVTPDILGAGAPTINVLNLRTSSYMYTGEQLQYQVVIRDADGALDITQAFLTANGSFEVVCSAAALPASCDGMVPPVGSGLANGVTNGSYDKAFNCTYTAEPLPTDSQITVSIGVTDLGGGNNSALYQETWAINPSVSLLATLTSGASIAFEPGQAGQFVHSTNKIMVTNTANKVDMWLFIAASDFTAPSGPALCPASNKIDVEGVFDAGCGDPFNFSCHDSTGLYYRAVSGSKITNLSEDPHDLPLEGWAHITNPDNNLACSFTSIATTGRCNGARPFFKSDFLQPGFPSPLTGWANNVLTPTGMAEIEFKLLYPVPCIGTFSQGTIYIFGKPI